MKSYHTRLEDLNEVPNDFENQAMTVFKVANRAKEIFKSSKAATKRKIINLSFPNLEITGQEALIYWHKPLDMFVKKDWFLVWCP